MVFMDSRKSPDCGKMQTVITQTNAFKASLCLRPSVKQFLPLIVIFTFDQISPI